MAPRIFVTQVAHDTASPLPRPVCLRQRIVRSGWAAATRWISSHVLSREWPSTKISSTPAPIAGTRSTAAAMLPASLRAGITTETRKKAIALAKEGITVSLAHAPLKEAAPDNPNPFNHTMNRGLTTDTYSVSYHGYAHSHIDALCHIAYKGQVYNGRPASLVTSRGGGWSSRTRPG